MYWDLDIEGRDTGADKLTRYISRGHNKLIDHRGQEMSDKEIVRFVEESEEYEHEKQLIMSPADGERMTDEEMSLAARKNMNEFLGGRESASYCFAIHRDTENPHVQVAVTGNRGDLQADLEECEEMRELAREQFSERQRQHARARRARERERKRQQQQEIERERERERERGRGRGRGGFR